MLRIIGLAVLGALLVADLVVVALLLYVVVRSSTGDAVYDPHGFALIFGIAGLIVLVPLGLLVAALLRWLARPLLAQRATRA